MFNYSIRMPWIEYMNVVNNNVTIIMVREYDETVTPKAVTAPASISYIKYKLMYLLWHVSILL